MRSFARWDRPIGWQLLMWPASGRRRSRPTPRCQRGSAFWQLIGHLILFFIGSVAMRGAGCTYNDLVDQDIDMAVARTRSRPLPSGRVSRLNAKISCATGLRRLLVLLSFNGFSIFLGILSLGVVAIYPFAKALHDWPQFFWASLFPGAG